MTRAAESGAYSGGIRAMLAQADVCPSCGRAHNTRQYQVGAPKASGCPDVVFGLIPSASPSLESQEPSPMDADAGSQLGPASAVYPGSLPMPQPASRRSSSFSFPWPMPTQAEDYL
ncbi:MAG: hypothetical protein L3K09_07840 [Thermoplasmata archaeon]|nr:hypothetical protein [Thermoplasmata archaeon]